MRRNAAAALRSLTTDCLCAALRSPLLPPLPHRNKRVPADHCARHPLPFRGCEDAVLARAAAPAGGAPQEEVEMPKLLQLKASAGQGRQAVLQRFYLLQGNGRLAVPCPVCPACSGVQCIPGVCKQLMLRATAALPPPPRLCLQVNYRTHSGILGVASAVVDVLKAFWPDSIDNLAREEAFFHVSHRCCEAPPPAGSHLAATWILQPCTDWTALPAPAAGPASSGADGVDG